MSNNQLDIKPEKGNYESVSSTQNQLKSSPKKVPRVSVIIRRPELAKKACELLGIDPQDLIKKSKEEMVDPKKTKEVNDLIYDHYMQRYQRKHAQIEAKTKQLAQTERIEEERRQDIYNSRSCISNSDDRVFSSKNNSLRSYRADYIMNDLRGAKTNLTGRSPRPNLSTERSLVDDDLDFENNDLAADVINNYKKKLEKVQDHWNEETKNFKNKPMNDPTKVLSHALKGQVSKLNRGIEKAERYAQSIIDLNNRRKALKKELEEKDNKIMEQKMKYEKGRSEILKKKHDTYEEKLKEIKEQQREFNRKLRKNAKKLQERFKDLDEKLNKDEEHRQMHVRAKSTDFMARLVKTKEQREAEYEEILQNHQKEKARIERNVDTVRTERKARCEESAKAFEEVLGSVKEKREILFSERKAKTIGRIVQKSLGTEQLKELLQTNMKKKSQEALEKYGKYKEHYHEVLKNRNQWVRSVAQQYRKSQERVKEHQEEKAKELDFKKEINNLRWKDQAENYTELKRMHELRNVQILEKEKADSLKLTLIKEQNQILSQARLDVDRRIKLRIDRVITSALKEEDTVVEQKKPHRPHTNRSMY